MIPNIIHYTFGFKDNVDIFSQIYYMSILITKTVLKNPDIYIWYTNKPEGIWWEKVWDLVIARKIDLPVHLVDYNGYQKYVYDYKIRNNIFKLKILNEYGGIYLNLDTIVVGNIDYIFNSNLILEQNQGINSSIIASSELNEHLLNIDILYNNNHSDSILNYVKDHFISTVCINIDTSSNIIHLPDYYQQAWQLLYDMSNEAKIIQNILKTIPEYSSYLYNNFQIQNKYEFNHKLDYQQVCYNKNHNECYIFAKISNYKKDISIHCKLDILNMKTKIIDLDQYHQFFYKSIKIDDGIIINIGNVDYLVTKYGILHNTILPFINIYYSVAINLINKLYGKKNVCILNDKYGTYAIIIAKLTNIIIYLPYDEYINKLININVLFDRIKFITDTRNNIENLVTYDINNIYSLNTEPNLLDFERTKIDENFILKYRQNFYNSNINFDYPVLVINMDRSISRLTHIKHQFNKYKTNFIRISAIDGNFIQNVNNGEIDGFKYKGIRSGSKYVLACTLSHIKTIKYAYDNNLGTTIIMEDDITLELCPFWKQTIKNIIEFAPSNWNIIQLYNNCCRLGNIPRYINYNEQMGTGTVCYIINFEGQKQILNTINDNCINFSNTDIAADYFIYSHVLNSYTYSIPLFIPNNDNDQLDSCIHTNHTESHIGRKMEIIKYYLNNLTPKLVNGKYPIWSCWPGYDDIPEYLKLCHETVKKYNMNNFSVILVTPHNLHDYIQELHPSYEYLSYAHKSDYLRCMLLHNYGGMYLDIDTICFNSLDEYFDKLTGKSIVGYNGLRWNEIWGMSVMGPLLPFTEYTFNWYTLLNTILNEKTTELKIFRQQHPTELNRDCLRWTEILRDIILPLSEKIDPNDYYLMNDDCYPINNIQILKSNLNFDMNLIKYYLILNNALYPSAIKKSNYNDIMNSDILLFNLLKYALNKPFEYAFPYVNHILYINLDIRIDRHTHIINELQKYFRKECIEKISAIKEKNGALGCLKSHIYALTRAKINYPGQNIMICEDDLIFIKNPKEYLIDFFQDLNLSNWNVLLLTTDMSNIEYTNNCNIIKTKSSRTSAGYIIKGSYVNILLSLYNSVLNTYNENNIWKNEYCVDQCWKILQSKDNWYTFSNRIAKQQPSYSDIENKYVKYDI